MRLFALVVVTSLFAVGLARADSLTDREGWQVLPTTKSYPALVDDLKSAIEGEGMLLVTQASASDGAKGRELPFPATASLASIAMIMPSGCWKPPLPRVSKHRSGSMSPKTPTAPQRFPGKRPVLSSHPTWTRAARPCKNLQGNSIRSSPLSPTRLLPHSDSPVNCVIDWQPRLVLGL